MSLSKKSKLGRPIRILFVVNVGWFFVSHRLVLARAALEAGYDVHVATTITDEKERVAILEAGLTLHDVTFDRSGFSIVRELHTVRSLISLYRKLRPDLIHHVTIKPILYGGLAARVCRIGAVVNAIPGLGYSFAGSNPWTRLRQRLIMVGYRFVLRRPNAYTIFQNVEHMQMFCDARVVKAANAVLIRGSGVNVAKFAVSPEPAGKIVVLLAARMLREKGIYEFVEAAASAHRSGVSVVFMLAGGPDEGNPGSIPLEQLENWHAAGVVDWLGFRDDMALLLAQCHIACLPTYGEGLPKFLLEAAASGRAIVTTDIPGYRDIARNDLNAILVPPQDAKSLGQAILKLANDDELRGAFGAAGRRLVEAEFSEAVVIEKTLDLYCSVMQQSKP
jgi:glycosyltransferase involved in cell wall biosynthesis